MKPRIQLAVLFALLACAAAFPEISVDQVNPPPSIAFAESHKDVESDGVLPKANVPEIKEEEVKPEVIKKADKPEEVKLEDVPQAPEADIVSKPAEKVKEEEVKPVAEKIENVQPLARSHSRRLRGKAARSSSMSIEEHRSEEQRIADHPMEEPQFEDYQIDGYVPFKAANAGGHLPPNQMRPLRQQVAGQHVVAQYPIYGAAQSTQDRADRRKRPSQDKNKKKSSSKKRRPSSSNSNNKKKDKKKVQPTKPAPTKKPVNKNRRGQPVNHNNNQNAAYRPNKHHANNNNHHQHHHANPQHNQLNKPVNNPQKNRRKATPAPPNAVAPNKRKQPNRRSPNARRKPTTKRPAARRRKQTYKEASSYYNDRSY